MSVNRNQVRRESYLSVCGAMLVVMLLASNSLSADEVHIDCNQDDAISQALGSMDDIGPHQIFVEGDCYDSVHILQRDRVTIAAEGFGASISPPDEASPFAIVVDSSRRIILQDLVIANEVFTQNPNGVWITNASDVDIVGGTIGNSISDGVKVSNNSLVKIAGTVIQNNKGSGLFVENGSTVQLGNGAPVSINNNGRGIVLSAATLRVEGGLAVDSNSIHGLHVKLGSRASINSDTGPNSFSSNSFAGVVIRTGSVAEFAGDNTIANNGRSGLALINGGTAVVVDRKRRYGNRRERSVGRICRSG